jgi:hypothetical protein
MPVAENHHSGQDRPRLRHSRLAGPALLFLVCAGFFWKLVLTNQYTWMESPDTANQVLPWLQFQASEWHRGRIPLWEAHVWGGQPLIGQAQPGAAYPLNWLLFALPLRNGWIRQSYLHWYFVLIHYMAALFCYWLCRDLKRSRAASVIAGAAFGLGGYVGTTDWPQMLNGAVWAPLVFLFLLRALRGEKPVLSGGLAGAALGMAWLSGHHQIPIYITLAAGAVWLAHACRAWRPQWRLAAPVGAFVLLMVLTSGLQMLPAYEYGRQAKRWVGAEEPVGWKEPVPYSVHSEFSLHPFSLLSIVFPGVQRHSTAFAGVTGLTLALLALGLAWNTKEVKLFSAVAAGGLLFSLGKNFVLHGLIYGLVPMVEKARNPSMAIFIFHFGLCVLIAYGIDCCSREDFLLRRAIRWLAGLGVFVFALLAALIFFQKSLGDDRFVVSGLMALLLSLLLHGFQTGGIGRPGFVAFLLLFVLTEHGNSSGIFYLHKDDSKRTIYLKQLRENSDIAAFLYRQPSPFRVEATGEDLPYSFGNWYGMDVMGGYSASLPERLLRLPYHDRRGRHLFGATYTVNRKPPGPSQREVFASKSGLRVHANLDSWPRVWTVHEATALKSPGEIPEVLLNDGFDLRRKTFLLGRAPQLEACEGEDSARITRHEPNRVVIEVRMNCRGMLILGDNYFPGWRAAVDGRSVPVYEAYTVVRGVVLDKGAHRVAMVYRPLSVMVGGVMTALGLVVTAVLAFMARRGNPL